MTYLFLGLASWIAAGLVAGLLAVRLLPGRSRLPALLALATGVGAALGGGLLATLLGFGGLASFDPRSLTTAALAAILALQLVQAARVAG